MQLPEITFSMDAEVYLPARKGDAGEEIPAELYGPDFGGTFVLRWPSWDDDAIVAARVAAIFQSRGANDAFSVGTIQQQTATALVFFGLLAKEKPAWCDANRPVSPKGRFAIARAYELAYEKINAEKKSSADAGVK